MNVGSVFSGVGLLDLGLCLAGHRIEWHCEADPWRRDILARRWPGVPCYEDIRDVGGDCPRVDILAGGPPCQPVSLAGKGLGDDDERWLWPEFFRALGELRPRYALMENPSALLARDGGRLFGDVLGGLAEVGYDAEWASFPASAIGAPHRRDRTFILAYPADPDEAELRKQQGRERGPGGAEGPPEPGDDGADRDAPDARQVERWSAGAGAGLSGARRGNHPGQPCPRGASPSADPDQERRERRDTQARAARSEFGGPGRRGSAADADPRGFARVAERNGEQETRIEWSLRNDAQRLGMDYWWSRRPPEPCLRGVDDGGSRMVGRSHMLGALGDGVVVAVGQLIGERLMEADR